jgi:hypothetical protein
VNVYAYDLRDTEPELTLIRAVSLLPTPIIAPPDITELEYATAEPLRSLSRVKLLLIGKLI